MGCEQYFDPVRKCSSRSSHGSCGAGIFRGIATSRQHDSIFGDQFYYFAVWGLSVPDLGKLKCEKIYSRGDKTCQSHFWEKSRSSVGISRRRVGPSAMGNSCPSIRIRRCFPSSVPPTVEMECEPLACPTSKAALLSTWATALSWAKWEARPRTRSIFPSC